MIAGTAKGVRLGPVPRGVRPVSDMAREGLFSSVASEVQDAVVLDLFAGTGALGIEALSRGAARAVFVERSATAIRTMADNLRRARLAERAVLVRSPVERFLMDDDNSGGPFDLCFADPPYDAPGEVVNVVLGALAGGWLGPGWTMALTRAKRSSTPVIPVDWRLAGRLEYGDSLVLVYRER